MAKLRVHEVAKQLDMTNARILEKLGELGVEVKSHMSTLEEEQVGRLRNAILPKPEAPKQDSAKQAQPVQVERPERPAGEQGQRRERPAGEQGQRRERPAGEQGQRRERPAGEQGQRRERPERPAGEQGQRRERPERPAGEQGQRRERPERPAGEEGQRRERPERPAGEEGQRRERPERPAGEQGQRRERPERPAGEQGQRRERPAGEQGQRRERPERPAGEQGQRRERPERPAGEQGQRRERPAGEQGERRERPERPAGEQGQRPDRPVGQSGQRPDRPVGQSGQRPERPAGQSGQRSDRPAGQSGQRQDRPAGQSGQRQDRPAGQSGQRQDRPAGQSGQRQDRPASQSGQRQDRPAGQSGQRQDRPAGQSGKSPATTLQSGQKPQQRTGQKPQRPEQSSQKPQIQRRQQSQAMPQLQKPQKAKSRPKAQHKQIEQPQELPVQEVLEDGIKVLRLGKEVLVKTFAEMLDEPGAEIIKLLMKRGLMVTLNQQIDFYTASQIAENYGCIVEKMEEIDLLEQEFAEDEAENEDDATARPPVVVVMGHVDHGKTSLLDYIRKSSVTSVEAGGITQHIGAYTVNVGGKSITFLDTPGHEAFTAMRMRGARVTDIAILVVAADDGVMPQTIEAINHAKAANVEIIVAINKIDKPSANPDRVKQELTEYGLLVEDWGGEIISCPVSAIKGDGIEHLLEMVLLVSEMKELKANPDKKARGTVIEALLDKNRGPVTTILVQNGTLRVGDPVVAGATYGKVRAMVDDKGNRLKSAGPSTPVEILGLNEVPMAGDMFYAANNEKHARQVAESVVAQGREDMIKAAPKVSLNDLFNQIQLGNVKDLNIVIKADVQGSVEAVKNSLERLSNDEVRIRTLHGGVGAITESDVMLASASNAIIIGFNVKPENNAKAVAETENVDIRLYRIIYNAIEDITAAMKGMLEPVYQEKVIGHAEIRQIFKASSIGVIAGSYITNGKITRNSKVRITRDGKQIYEGTLDTLKRFKDDVKEVNSGYECGLLFNKFNDIQEGDKVEAYVLEEVPR